MDIAFLFNANEVSLGTLYGRTVAELILGTRVLQTIDRHVKVSLGDVLTLEAAAQIEKSTFAQLRSLCREVYRPKCLNLLFLEKLEATHGHTTVFTWVFANMTQEIGERLHSELQRIPAYLGAMDVDFSNALQLAMFRNSLPEVYRLSGRQWSIFYSMGENEDPDASERELFESHDFEVHYEDTGGRRTIFDEFCHLDHFRRVADFKRIFRRLGDLDDNLVSDLVFMLEEIHPRLFNTLAAAARTLERAETDEDFAQVALSGRRVLEQTADCRFPPTMELRHTRKLDRAAYKNRLWAYIEDALHDAGSGGSGQLEVLGNELDRLVGLFNAGLHAHHSREKANENFCDLVRWLDLVLTVNPSYSRRAYLAYEENIQALFKGMLRSASQMPIG